MHGLCALNNWGFQSKRFLHRVLAVSLAFTLALPIVCVPSPARAEVFSGINGVQLQDLEDNLVQLVFQADLPFEYQVKVLNPNQVLIRLRTAQLASTLKTDSGLLNLAPTASVTAVTIYPDPLAPALSETLLLEGPSIGTKRIQVQGALLNLNPFDDSVSNKGAGTKNAVFSPITALHLADPLAEPASTLVEKRLAQAKHLPPMPVKPVTPPKQNRAAIVQLATKPGGASPAFDTIPFSGKQPFYKPLALSPNPAPDNTLSNTPVITASAEKGLSIESLKPLPRYRGGAPPIQFTVSTTGETFTLPSAPVGVLASETRGKANTQIAKAYPTREQLVYKASEPVYKAAEKIAVSQPTAAAEKSEAAGASEREKKRAQSVQPVFPVKQVEAQPKLENAGATEAVAALHVAESLAPNRTSEKRPAEKRPAVKRLSVDLDEDDVLVLKTTLKSTEARRTEVGLKSSSEKLTFASDAPQSLAIGASRVPQLLQEALEQVRQRGFESARQKVLQAQLQDPENPKVHAALAEIAVCQNQWQAAEIAYAKATRLAHEAHQGYALDYRYAVVLAQLGKREKAIERLQAVVGENPNHASAQALLGKLYQASGETAQALRQYQESLSLNPNQPEIHYELGLLYELEGKRQLAAEHYAQAKSLRPEDVMVQRAYQRVIGHARG